MATGVNTKPWDMQVAYIGHSNVKCDVLRPREIEGVDLTLISVGGARADTFFSRPEFRPVLSPGFDLVIVMLGGNDIGPSTVMGELVQALKDIHAAIEATGATCLVCTIEKREYPTGHPHYVDPVIYNKICNGVNKKIQKEFKGKIIILGGRIFPVELRLMDGVHATLEGRQNIWRKVLGAIRFWFERWNPPTTWHK